MANNANSADAGRDIATISSGVTITGDVDCAGELQISGRVNGQIRAAAVFVEAGGEVNGGISADRLRVSGSVEGTLKVGDLAIEPNGEVRGDVQYGRLKIAAGGFIEGTFARSGAQPASAEERSVKLVPSPEADNPRRVYVD